MAKLSAGAVSAAVQLLSELDVSPEQEGYLEVFLTGRYLSAKGERPSIKSVNEAVSELFLVLPAHPNGRCQPFSARLAGSRPRGWIQNSDDSGRSTVWNQGTRTNAKELAVNDHLKNGLVTNAADLVAAKLTEGADRRPSRVALLVFLLRNHDFAAQITEAVLEQTAATALGLSAADLTTITKPISIGVALTGNPPWDPTQLALNLMPQANTTPAPAPAAPATAPPPFPAPAVAPAVIQVDSRIRRMVERSITSAHAVMLVGPPGTGKSTLLHEVALTICRNPNEFGIGTAPLPDPIWVTAEEGWTARDLIGGESLVGGKLVFRPGHLLRAIMENRWLVIDEANRADMDKIFGPIFTWLSGSLQSPPVSLGVRAQGAGQPSIELSWNTAQSCLFDSPALLERVDQSEPPGSVIRFRAGTGWRLLGTYNAIDAQRVFRIGQALGRRFTRVPIPAASDVQFRQALDTHCGSLDPALRTKIAQLYASHLQRPETTLGPAMFLRIGEYVRAAQDLAASADKAAAGEAGVTEGYLVNVGPWLTRLEDSERAALGALIKLPAGPMSDQDWAWIESLVPNLG